MKITIIGAGGCGNNVLNHIIENESLAKYAKNGQNINFVVVSTDINVLKPSKILHKIQLIQEEFIEENVNQKSSYKSIKSSLENSDIVILAAELDGNTSSIETSVVAKIAKEIGVFTVCIVAKPFFQGDEKRIELANLYLEELKKTSDSIIAIPNDKFLEKSDENIVFKEIDDILHQAVSGICEIILDLNSYDINADFEEIRTLMKYKGLAFIGIGHAKGENASVKALENAIESALLDKVSLNEAKGVMVHFTISPNISLIAISNAMEEFNKIIDPELDIIFGATTDDTLATDEVKITLVATGFKREGCADKKLD